MISDETRKEAWDIFKQALGVYEGCLEAELGIIEASEQVEFIIGERLESYKFEIKANNTDIDKLQAELEAAYEELQIYRFALEGLTPAGAEFRGHPDHCEGWVRERVKLLQELVEYWSGRVATLKAEREGLQAVVEVVRKLIDFNPEFKPFGFNAENPNYEDGDERSPFYSEGFLYPLLGKEDARTLLSYLGRLQTILVALEKE